MTSQVFFHTVVEQFKVGLVELVQSFDLVTRQLTEVLESLGLRLVNRGWLAVAAAGVMFEPGDVDRDQVGQVLLDHDVPDVVGERLHFADNVVGDITVEAPA